MTITQNVPCDERFPILRSLYQQQLESFATPVVDLSGGANVYAVNVITAERDDYTPEPSAQWVVLRGFAGVDLQAAIEPWQFVGRPSEQVDEFVKTIVAPLRHRYPGRADLSSDVSV